jgi:hypothetical protein
MDQKQPEAPRFSPENRKSPSLWLVGHSNFSVGCCLSASEILLQWSFRQGQRDDHTTATKQDHEQGNSNPQEGFVLGKFQHFHYAHPFIKTGRARKARPVE